MLGSDVIRGYVDTMLLALLREKPDYGYSLQREISLRTGGRYVLRETTLYSAITRLERGGYLTSAPGEETQGRTRRYYHITAAGEALYRDKCAEWQLIQRIIQPFITKE